MKANSLRDNGFVIGKTASGKEVFSNKRVYDYLDFSSADHMDAAYLHIISSRENGVDSKALGGVQLRPKLHLDAARYAEKRESVRGVKLYG